jgi:hypothetical protein
MTPPDAPSDDEERIREKAYALWEAEGHPHGRSEAHWTMAREMVAVEDSFSSTLLPVHAEEPAEPAIALENQGEFPGLADQGEETPHVPHEPVVEAPAAPARRVRETARASRR